MRKQRWSRACKRSYFKTGHQYIPRPDTTGPPEEVKRNFTRLDHSTFNLGPRDTDRMPSILRPKPNVVEGGETSNENFVNNAFVNLEKVSKFMTVVWKAHYLKSAQCLTQSFSFLYSKLNMFGLETSVAVACNTCGFLNQTFELFNRLKLNGHGPYPVELNARLGQYLASSEVSLNSVTSLFAILGTHAPSENTLKKHLYRAASFQTALGQNQLDKNQNSLQKIISHLPKKWALSCGNGLWYCV